MNALKRLVWLREVAPLDLERYLTAIDKGLKLYGSKALKQAKKLSEDEEKITARHQKWLITKRMPPAARANPVLTKPQLFSLLDDWNIPNTLKCFLEAIAPNILLEALLISNNAAFEREYNELLTDILERQRRQDRDFFRILNLKILLYEYSHDRTATVKT